MFVYSSLSFIISLFEFINLVLKNISIRWKRCYWNEYEQCQINGAFRKSKIFSLIQIQI